MCVLNVMTPTTCTDDLYSVFHLVETFPKHDISQTEVLVSCAKPFYFIYLPIDYMTQLRIIYVYSFCYLGSYQVL